MRRTSSSAAKEATMPVIRSSLAVTNMFSISFPQASCAVRKHASSEMASLLILSLWWVKSRACALGVLRLRKTCSSVTPRILFCPITARSTSRRKLKKAAIKSAPPSAASVRPMPTKLHARDFGWAIFCVLMFSKRNSLNASKKIMQSLKIWAQLLSTEKKSSRTTWLPQKF